ncbi:MAG: glycosyltransferase, partial [Nitrospirota bacterium]
MGIPIVSTEAGCRGIKVIDGKHLLIAKNEDEFIKKVIELLINTQKAQVLAKSARKLVEQKYSWKKIVNYFELKLKQNV